MKVLKWFSLFFMSVFVAFAIGMVAGWRLEAYFYPEEGLQELTSQDGEPEQPSVVIQEPSRAQGDFLYPSLDVEQAIAVSDSDERIRADTLYVIIERNMDTDEEVENVSRMPQMYLGMNREQFLASMEDYEAGPPLSELERGFVNLEVQSFSGAKVEVLMNYSYVKPSKSFYIVVYNGLVTVLLEDKETLYLQTGMKVLNLPEDMQQELIHGMYVPDEESLYDFLENYTS